MQREMMKLQQEEGFNPLSGCLPMFLQIPIFISLFHVLRHLSNSVSLCHAVTARSEAVALHASPRTRPQAAKAKLFGAPAGGFAARLRAR